MNPNLEAWNKECRERGYSPATLAKLILPQVGDTFQIGAIEWQVVYTKPNALTFTSKPIRVIPVAEKKEGEETWSLERFITFIRTKKSAKAAQLFIKLLKNKLTGK